MVTPYYWILNVETSFNKDSKHDSSYYEILFPSVKPNFIGVAALIISSQIVCLLLESSATYEILVDNVNLYIIFPS